MKQNETSDALHMTPAARGDFVKSMIALACLFTCVLVGLAYEENWRKLARIFIAFFTYAAILLSLLTWRGGAGKPTGARLPFWPFAVAAASAELTSGWLRPAPAIGLGLWLAPAAAFLIGGVHWLTLYWWRPLRERITRGA